MFLSTAKSWIRKISVKSLIHGHRNWHLHRRMSKQFQRIFGITFVIIRLDLIVHIRYIDIERMFRNMKRHSLLIVIEQLMIIFIIGYKRLLEAWNGIHRIMEVIAHTQIRIIVITIGILRVDLVWRILRGTEAWLGLCTAHGIVHIKHRGIKKLLTIII